MALGAFIGFACGRTPLDSSTSDGAGDGGNLADPSCEAAVGLATLATGPQSDGPQSAGPLVVDATNVYWTGGSNCIDSPCEDQSQVMQCSKCGCSAPTVLAGEADFFGGLAIDATSVYWTNAGSVMRVPIGGGAIATLAAAAARDIAVDSTAVYWTDSSTVMRVPLAGGNPTTLATGLASPGVIAVDDTHLYWSDNVAGTITRAALDGGSPTVLATGQSPSAIAVDAESVYWTNVNGDAPGAAVMKVAIAGGSVTTLASGIQGPWGMAVDATDVYWTTEFTVRSVPKGGGSVADVFRSDASDGPIGVAVDATSVYWTDSSGAVTRLTPK